MSKKSQEFSWKYNAVTIQEPDEGTSILDVVRTSFVPNCHIKKISKTEYIKGRYKTDGSFLSDGEVYTFTEKEQPMRNRRSLRQIFRTLRQLIAANFRGGDSEVFLTLTYAAQTNDPVQIYQDIDKFWKRLKYRYKMLKYIAIVEPHASGMFHIHMLIADETGTPLFIPWEVLKDTWGLGMIEVDRLEDIDHMGAYFIAYFSNLELTPDEVIQYEAEGDVEEKNGKKYIKGKRLDFYPEHMRIYRHSRNCTKPEKVTGEEVELMIDGADLRFMHETEFEDQGQVYHLQTAQYIKRGTMDGATQE